MRRMTTTKKINAAIANNLLCIEKAEIDHKTSGRTETIDADMIYENFSFLCESGIFADCTGWYYERDCKSNGYIVECGRKNPDSEVIVTVYLGIGGDVNVEDIERTLLFLEEE